MVRKKVIGVVLSALIISVILCVYVSAITGSIGNGRAVLHAEVGDKLERFVVVKNVNDIPLEIELSASGDLANYTKIKDNNFTLPPGQEKNAYFTIDVKKNGTTETRINVKFTPEEGSGVGLSATLIIIAKNKGEATSDDEDIPVDEEGGGDDTSIDSGTEENNISKIVLIGTASTAVVLVIFIVLLVMLFKKSGKKRKRKK